MWGTSRPSGRARPVWWSISRLILLTFYQILAFVLVVEGTSANLNHLGDEIRAKPKRRGAGEAS